MTLRTGKLNEDGAGSSSVSNSHSTDFLSFEINNSMTFPSKNVELQALLGWESLDFSNSRAKDEGIICSLIISRIF
jgi:hypothetical protein